MLTAIAISGGHPLVSIPSGRVLSRSVTAARATALRGTGNHWWEGNADGYDKDKKSFVWEKPSESQQQQQSSTLITPMLEEEVMASARSTMDSNTISRALSSLLTNSINETNNNSNSFSNTDLSNNNIETIQQGSKNNLRDLALGGTNRNYNGAILSNRRTKFNKNDNNSSSSSSTWDTQQIAIASGVTTLLLSPIIIPIIHSLLPPILPFPSSIGFNTAALLGTLAYIVALGDPTEQTNYGDGVEVGGAVSRVVGRTALQSAKASAPRLQAAARAMVDYDTTKTTIDELTQIKNQLTQTVNELSKKNEVLTVDLALWRAVEDISNMYKLEELKELARYHGLKGYSGDGKNALLRRLAKEGIVRLDITPYY